MFSELQVPFKTTFDRILELGYEERKDLGAMGLKLFEECGEFAETVNFHLGNLPHKQLKERPIDEAADVIQNVIAMLSKIYADQNPEWIYDELLDALDRKTDKWQAVMYSTQLESSPPDEISAMYR